MPNERATPSATPASGTKQFAAEMRSTWLLLYPMILSSVAGYCMTLFDYRWIRGLPATDVALLALVNGSVVAFVFLLGKSFEESFVAIFAKAAHDRQGALLVQSLLLAGSVGLLVALLLIGAGNPLLNFVSGGGFRGGRVLGYYALVVSTFPVSLLSTVLSAALRTHGDSKSPARISIVCGVVNNLLDPLLVFGLFGAHPSRQMFGLALASWATKGLYLGWAIFAVRARLQREAIVLPRPRADWPTQWRILRLFVPSAALETLTFVANSVLYSLIARYGVQAIGGYGIGFELMTIGFILIKGLSMVFMIRIGHRVRAGAPAHAAVHSVMLLGVAFTATISAVFYLLGPFALRFLASDAGVIHTAAMLLDYVPLFVFSYLLTNLVTGCFQIIERPARAMWLGLLFAWIITPGTVYLTVSHHLPLGYVFATLGAVSIVRQAVYLTIFLRVMRRLGATALPPATLACRATG